MIRIVPVAIAVIASAFVSSADATVLCRKPGGRVAAIERCGRRDTPLTPRDLGLVGVTGSAGPAGPAGSRDRMPFRIVDGTGRDVCLVTEAGVEPQCVLTHPALSRPVLLSFRDDRLPVTEGGGTVYYVAPGCSGTPHVGFARPLMPRAVLAGDSLYYGTSEARLTAVTSTERVEEPCPGVATTRGTCCETFPASVNRHVGPAERVALSTLGLEYPLEGVVP